MNKSLKIAILSVLISSSAFASETPGSADWITEASTMVVKGQAAKDLYYSLNAPEKLDPLSTKYDQYRTKKNKFAECGVSFYRTETADGDTDWLMQDDAECKITAPKGTAINE